VTDPTRSELTHLDSEGQARMVDVTQKDRSRRYAVARCNVLMKAETIALVTTA
jgi:cyclic pyranopterin phosphate synthase